MEPLQFLFVSLDKECRTLLIQSLQNLSYTFELCEVQNKKQALEACYNARYDVLVTNEVLPDGSSADLIKVLSELMPCLIIQEKTKPTVYQHFKTSHPLTNFSYLPQNESPFWEEYLECAITKWENNVLQKVNALQESHRSLYDKVTAACAAQLCEHLENRVENTLQIILEVLQVSKAYIRTGTSNKHLYTHEVHSSGMYFSDTFESVYEVPVQRPNGRTDYLGVVECLYNRTWQKVEIDLLKSIALLFQENRSILRRKINIYAELSLTA